MSPFRTLGKLLVLMGLTPCIVFAASESPVTETQLAEKLRFYATIGTLEADFHQVKDLKELGMKMTSEGRLILKRTDSVIWEVTKPARVKVELGTTGIRITSGEGATATVQNFPIEQMPNDKNTSSLHDLVAWLKLDAHALSTEYTITKTTSDHFVFTPKKVGPFKSMEMDLSGAGHLERLVLNETSGDEMIMTFARPRVRKTLPPHGSTP